MRELQQTGVMVVSRGSADSAALTEELHKLRGEVDQKKYHNVVGHVSSECIHDYSVVFDILP
jgi:hypothetical protein